ncbi:MULTISPECIES: response regulator transcription factor [Campylobacter]|uniref:Two-component system response regulator n=1 Tax=Campylobacter porcelli TaxID=1660073 RepID=A0A1X9SVJ2_9BACT|nr:MULTISPECIES: response regulator transcription factor [unclassified Campylobacter]ARR00251.1 two-component system response regulator [Campylobacter sp. RM6137]MCR8696200.1 response regulator transcription factor [Campylobacter sp. RM19073]
MNEILKSLTILFVEDDNDVKSWVSKSIDGVFKNLILAKNGDEGLKKFKKYNPDIVITDIVMPIIDGLEMTKQIKSISRSTPVIVLSAFSDQDRLLGAIDAGVNKYLIKPVEMQELLEIIYKFAKDMGFIAQVDFGNGVKFDKAKRALINSDGVEISLTKKEIAFLMLLTQRMDTLVLHEDIKQRVWTGQKVSEAAIRTFVKRIRDKIGANLIKNISGLGYKITTNDEK